MAKVAASVPGTLESREPLAYGLTPTRQQKRWTTEQKVTKKVFDMQYAVM